MPDHPDGALAERQSRALIAVRAEEVVAMRRASRDMAAPTRVG